MNILHCIIFAPLNYFDFYLYNSCCDNLVNSINEGDINVFKYLILPWLPDRN